MKRVGAASLLALLLVSISALIYWPGLSGGFLFDDYPNIVTNPNIHIDSLAWADIRTAADAYHPGSFGRPMATVGFAVDYYLGGKNAWGYKLHSLLVHLLNTVLVFYLVRRLLVVSEMGSRNHAKVVLVVSFFVALVWSAHPLQVSTVLYVVQRMEMLSLLFVLLALIAYLHGRTKQVDTGGGWGWIILSVCLSALGLLGKENAVLFPAYTLGLELAVLGFGARERRTEVLLKGVYAVGAAVAVLLFVFYVIPSYANPDVYASRDFTVGERLLSQMRILPMYLGQIFLPLPSSMLFYYDAYPKSTGLFVPFTTFLGAISLIGLFLTAWLLRWRLPLMALGIFWFFTAHLLTSNVFNLELVFEHRNYFALLGVLIATTGILRRIIPNNRTRLSYTLIGLGLVSVCLLTLLRTATWGNQLLLANTLAAGSPESARASSDLATLYVGLSENDPTSPLFELGRAEFERGARLADSSPLPEQGLILMAAIAAESVDPVWWDRLIEKLRLRPIGPQETAAVSGLMAQRYEGLELDDARLSEAFATLLARKPASAQFAQYGDFALRYLHDEDLADRMFVSALEHSPADHDYAVRLISALMGDERLRQARLVADKAVELGLLDAELIRTIQVDSVAE